MEWSCYNGTDFDNNRISLNTPIEILFTDKKFRYKLFSNLLLVMSAWDTLFIFLRFMYNVHVMYT